MNLNFHNGINIIFFINHSASKDEINDFVLKLCNGMPTVQFTQAFHRAYNLTKVNTLADLMDLTAFDAVFEGQEEIKIEASLDKQEDDSAFIQDINLN
jgi:hypothetical protein